MAKEIYTETLRRLKLNATVRSLISPIKFSHQSFILPLFVEENLIKPRPIQNMESVSVQTITTINSRIEKALENGINKFLLFPVPENKKEIPHDFSFASELVNKIKSQFNDQLWLAADICLCSYTTHGHCGILNANHSKILNHESVELLSQYATMLAKAGADCLAPSDMMDGRIKAIRSSLHENGLDDKIIMAYSAKFSSQYYGPFRDACHSSPSGSTLKDRKSYQLSPFNKMDALNAAIRDSQEGADILMVKPAGLYTDIVTTIKNNISKPLAAYHVSGEYTAIEIMAERGILDRAKAHLETWAALSRSGADIIISYAAENAKTWIDAYEY